MDTGHAEAVKCGTDTQETPQIRSEELTGGVQLAFAGVTDNVNQCLAYMTALERGYVEKSREVEALQAELDALRKKATR